MLPFAQSLIGQSFGKYRLDRVLGSGGMGVVFEARHQLLGSLVAIKIIQPALGDDDFARRFLLEAQLLAELKHPHIVEIYDVDVGPFELPYYVMERLEGETVARWQKASADGAPLQETLEIIGSAGAALLFAHDRGVIHRDLKPENIFLHLSHGKRVVKLLDFGIAKLLDGSNQRALTATGAMIGTLNYASPEQLLGQEISVQVDQFALALTMAEMLTAKPARDPTLAPLRLLSEATQPIDERYVERLPESVRAAFVRATAPRARDRFESIAEFLDALGAPYRRTLTQRMTPVSHDFPLSQLTPPPSTRSKPIHTAQTPTIVTQAPTAPARQANRTRVFGLIAFSVVLIVLLGWWLAARSLSPIVTPDTSVASKPVEATFELKPTSIARMVSVTRVPVDAFALLGLDRSGSSAILQARQRWYLQATGGEQRDALPFALDPGEAILGYWPFVYLKRDLGAMAILGAQSLEAVSTRGGSHEKVFDLSLLKTLAGIDAAQRFALDDEQALLALKQPGALEIYELSEGISSLLFSVPLSDPVNTAVKLSRRYIALSEPTRRLRILAAHDGQTRLDVMLDGSQVTDVALLDDPGVVAVRDRAKEVSVYWLGANAERAKFAVSEDTSPLLWVPDKPTLLFQSGSGLMMWRRGMTAALRAEPQVSLESSRLTAADGLLAIFSDGESGVLALRSRSQEIASYRYGDTAVTALGPLLRSAFGAKVVDERGKRVFIGDDSGRIERTDGESSEVAQVHTSMIRAMTFFGPHILSAAEHGDVASMDPDSMKVIHSAKISACEIVPGVVSFQPQTSALWTVCADQSVRKFSWPELDQLERIDAALNDLEVLKIASAADGEHVVLSTLNRTLVVLKKQTSGAWAARRYPIPSARAVSFKSLDDLDVLIFRGFNANRLWAFDAKRDELLEIPATFGVTIFGLDVASGSAFTTSARGVLFRYQLMRGSTGQLSYEVRADIRTDLFGFQAHTLNSINETWVAAPSQGQTRLVKLKTEALSQDILASGALNPFSSPSEKQ